MSLNYVNPGDKYKDLIFTLDRYDLFVRTLLHFCTASCLYVPELSGSSTQEQRSIEDVEARCVIFGLECKSNRSRNDEVDCTICSQNVQIKSSTQKVTRGMYYFTFNHSKDGQSVPYSADTKINFFLFVPFRNDKKIFVIPKQILIESKHLSNRTKNIVGKTAIYLASEERKEYHWSQKYLDFFDQFKSNIPIESLVIANDTASRFQAACQRNKIDCMRCTTNISATRCSIGNLLVQCIGSAESHGDLYTFRFCKGGNRKSRGYKNDDQLDFLVLENGRRLNDFFIFNRGIMIEKGIIGSHGKEGKMSVALPIPGEHKKDHWAISYYNQFSLLTSPSDTIPEPIPFDDTAGRFQNACLANRITPVRCRKNLSRFKFSIGNLTIKCIHGSSMSHKQYSFRIYPEEGEKSAEYDFFVFENFKEPSRFYIVPAEILYRKGIMDKNILAYPLYTTDPIGLHCILMLSIYSSFPSKKLVSYTVDAIIGG